MCTYRRTVTYFLTVLRLLKSFVFGSTGTARCVRICLLAPQKYSYQQKVLQKYVCFYAELRINYFKLLGSMILILITNDRTSYYTLHLKSCFLYEVIFAFYVLTESLFGISESCTEYDRLGCLYSERRQSFRRNLEVPFISREVRLILHCFTLVETTTRHSASRRLSSRLRQEIPGINSLHMPVSLLVLIENFYSA